MNHKKWLRYIAFSSIVSAMCLIFSIVYMCGFYFPHIINHNQSISLYADSCYWENLQAVKDIQTVALDSFAEKRFLDIIRKNQMYILKRQDKLVDDLRQETNSNLDKINMWLSFWIGLLAIMGVLAPVVAEYRFKVDNDIEKGKLTKLREDYQYRLSLLDAQSAIHSIEISHDERMILNFSERDRLLHFLLIDVANCINQLLLYISNQQHEKSKEERIICGSFLVRSLISLYAFVHRLGTMDVGIRMRDIQNVLLDIQGLIRETEQNYTSDYEQINKKMMELTTAIKGLFRQMHTD